jgi:hypothetical protein
MRVWDIQAQLPCIVSPHACLSAELYLLGPESFGSAIEEPLVRLAVRKEPVGDTVSQHRLGVTSNMVSSGSTLAGLFQHDEFSTAPMLFSSSALVATPLSAGQGDALPSMDFDRFLADALDEFDAPLRGGVSRAPPLRSRLCAGRSSASSPGDVPLCAECMLAGAPLLTPDSADGLITDMLSPLAMRAALRLCASTGAGGGVVSLLSPASRSQSRPSRNAHTLLTRQRHHDPSQSHIESVLCIATSQRSRSRPNSTHQQYPTCRESSCA